MKKKKTPKFQLNLDSFLGIKTKIKQYFYIDWNTPISEDNPVPLAHFLDSKPSPITWSSIIKWKDVGDIIICSNDNKSFIEDDSKLNVDIQNIIKRVNEKHWDEKRHLMNFLKSHIQKCVRRQKNFSALKSAYEMILLNINEILRRQCIFIFEDVRLKKYFSTMVWLMAAVSKGYTLQSYHINLELKIINDICLEGGSDDEKELNNKIFANDKTIITGINVRDFLFQIENSFSNNMINNEQISILYSIGLRIGFGGREGDMKMIFDYAQLWYRRFILRKNDTLGNLDIEKSKFVCIEFCKENRFKKIDDFVFQGVDMNSYRNICQEICRETEYHYQPSEIESAIWFCSSSVNRRKLPFINEKIMSCWEDIKNILVNKQLYFLDHILKNIYS